jgi:hypothetical protein
MPASGSTCFAALPYGRANPRNPRAGSSAIPSCTYTQQGGMEDDDQSTPHPTIARRLIPNVILATLGLAVAARGSRSRLQHRSFEWWSNQLEHVHNGGTFR